MRLYEFAGRLAGVALRTQKPLSCNWPGLMWKRIVGEALTMEDLRNVDDALVEFLTQVVHAPGVTDNDTFAAAFPGQTFTVVNAEGDTVSWPCLCMARHHRST